MGWHDEDSSKVDRKRWARLRQEVLNRDNWRCVQCGRRGRLEVDHIKPMRKIAGEAHGGAVYELSNLQTLCREHAISRKTAKENQQDAEGPEQAEWRDYVARDTNL